MTDQPVPPLTVNPLALSLEHHFLRALNGTEPTTRAEAVATILRRHPVLTRIGTPEHLTPTAARAWEEVTGEATDRVPWCRFVRRSGKAGFVLTGAGDARLDVLWRNQVITPYLKALEASHGLEVARAEAARLQGK